MVRHGSQIDPPNRFEKVHVVPDWEQLEWDVEWEMGWDVERVLEWERNREWKW